jgi:site-specific recombinase
MLFARLFRNEDARRQSAEAKLAAVLAAFRDPDADTLELLRRLVGVIRPHGRSDEGATERYEALLVALEADPALCAAFRGHVLHLLATRRVVTFFTESGILPATGFFSEWLRILASRLLPEVPDTRQLKDCLQVIYERDDDWRWKQAISDAQVGRLWSLLLDEDALGSVDLKALRAQILDAVLLIAHRVSGLGVEGELMRASPNFDADLPSFVALSGEALVYVNSLRAVEAGADGAEADDGGHLLVIVDQCRATLGRVRKRALSVGTSLRLSYLLARAEQSLDRLADLVAILRTTLGSSSRGKAVGTWAGFMHDAFIAENRRNSMRNYLRQLSELLAVRVTENAAHSGEHYICESRADYGLMWRSAAGAGVLIGCMALLKIYAGALHAPLFVEAFLFSLIYGGGFVAIYLFGMTVATKQPAMTAQTLAGLLGDIRPTRQADLERVADVVAAVSRSQLAAIAGNVMLAFPIAIAIGFAISLNFGHPIVPLEKAAHLIADLDPLSWALPHAAIAGFYLFLSGLITGYFDNRASYTNLGERIGRLRWLCRLIGRERAGRVGRYIGDHLGGIMGNFLFGCMLGATGVIGTILGLPLDIRHIAFASANLGYALNGFEFALAWQAVAWAVLGVCLIGLVNLAVSFALALRTALGARGIRFEHWGPLNRTIWRRFRQSPRSFLLPPRVGAAAGNG